MIDVLRSFIIRESSEEPPKRVAIGTPDDFPLNEKLHFAALEVAGKTLSGANLDLSNPRFLFDERLSEVKGGLFRKPTQEIKATPALGFAIYNRGEESYPPHIAVLIARMRYEISDSSASLSDTGFVEVVYRPEVFRWLELLDAFGEAFRYTPPSQLELFEIPQSETRMSLFMSESDTPTTTFKLS